MELAEDALEDETSCGYLRVPRSKPGDRKLSAISSEWTSNSSALSPTYRQTLGHGLVGAYSDTQKTASRLLLVRNECLVEVTQYGQEYEKNTGDTGVSINVVS